MNKLCFCKYSNFVQFSSKLILVLVALLQPSFGYHRVQYELPRDFNRFIDFNNFDDTRRTSRQLGGFNWDAPSSFDNSFNNNGRLSNSFEPDNQDTFIFEDDFENRNFVTTQRPYQRPTFRRRVTTQRTQSSTVAIPGMGTPRTPCEDRCLSTPEYNPVCGDDDMTYFSMHRLNCARKCGKSK